MFTWKKNVEQPQLSIQLYSEHHSVNPISVSLCTFKCNCAYTTSNYDVIFILEDELRLSSRIL